MLIERIKNAGLRAWTNSRSWKPKSRIVVFESDDWGSIRLPGRKGLKQLADSGIRLDRSGYDRLDCLENGADLEALFNTLSDFRDQIGRHPIFTLNTVMQNPDFEKIRHAGFRSYIGESFFESYRRYKGQDLRAAWSEAIQDGLIKPQFHAREHLNSDLWLHDLQRGVQDTIVAFDLDFFAHQTVTGSGRHDIYLVAHWPESENNRATIENSLLEGLDRFEECFGYRSKTFVPCCYHFYSEGEAFIAEHGVKLIQGQRAQLEPRVPGLDSSYRVKRRYTGQINPYGQIYTVRNVLFEPYLDQSRDWVSVALDGIRNAFLFGAPAIVCSHRVNYVGGIDLKHRDTSIHALSMLLQEILKRWPDVEFLSSDQLLDRIEI